MKMKIKYSTLKVIVLEQDGEISECIVFTHATKERSAANEAKALLAKEGRTMLHVRDSYASEDVIDVPMNVLLSFREGGEE